MSATKAGPILATTYLDFSGIRSTADSTTHDVSSVHGHDSTRIGSLVPRAAVIAAAALTLALLSFAAAAPPARADGDPASDVLSVQNRFVPADAGVPFGEQLELNGLLSQAARGGYPLRVAIVASPSDLGSVSALWRQPQSYAHFLGGELSLVYHGTVLVVMPNGYGTDVTAAGVRTASGNAELPVPGSHLAVAAISAVEHLASGAGVTLSAHAVAPVAAAPPGSSLPWVAFAAGFLPLAAAWGLSLRRRPIRSGAVRGGAGQA